MFLSLVRISLTTASDSNYFSGNFDLLGKVNVPNFFGEGTTGRNGNWTFLIFFEAIFTGLSALLTASFY